jgi:hypothetical protein
MGIEPSAKEGFLVEDLIFLIKGHVKKGYKASTKISLL